MARRSTVLFGEDVGWSLADWTSSDDRVRGGKSRSHLTLVESHAVFHGNLDIETLGGAGFASQRTTGDDRSWDLAEYDGICLKVSKADKKRYTFIIKDEILPPSPNGREHSTISYEYDFQLDEAASMGGGELVFVPWKDLKATYRGKEKADAPKLDCKSVKRFSIMMRSYFGSQEGDFSLTLISIAAYKQSDESSGAQLQGSWNPLTWLVKRVWKM